MIIWLNISSYRILEFIVTKCKPSAQFDRNVVTLGLKTPFHVLGEYNGTKTELYQTNAKNLGLVPAHFELIIIIAVHVVKHQSVINKYMQKAGEPENDAGFHKVIVISAVHVAS